jgi:hypothetical protein
MRGVTNEESSRRAAEQNGIEIGLSQPSGRPVQRGVHGQTDVLGDPLNLDRGFFTYVAQRFSGLPYFHAEISL